MKEPTIVRRTTCRMCGSSNLDLVLRLAPSPIGDAYVPATKLNIHQESYPIDLFLCRDCGLAQLLDIIAPEILYRDYIYMTCSSTDMQDHFKKYAKEVVKNVKPTAGNLIVDIGSNDGTLLQQFKKYGLQVLGVEPADEIARKATENGVMTIQGFFTPELAFHIKQKNGPAHIITANNVFANVDDLVSLTEGIRSLLAPDGVFIFESFYLADVIENKVFDFIYHEHLSAFSVAPVQRFFQRLGMQLIDVQRIPTKGGSLRYTIQLAGGPRAVSSSVKKMLDFEETFGLYHLETYKIFTNKIDELKQLTLAQLKKIKSEGKTVAGYGASITGTTLIYHFELGDYLDYLVDDNPAKQGLFSPGHHIPVYSPQELYERNPDYVIILAWRFAELILKRHRAYLNQGGMFIIPVPSFQIIQKS
jgi:SAM-dependent methyltransferase